MPKGRFSVHSSRHKEPQGQDPIFYWALLSTVNFAHMHRCSTSRSSLIGQVVAASGANRPAIDRNAGDKSLRRRDSVTVVPKTNDRNGSKRVGCLERRLGKRPVAAT